MKAGYVYILASKKNGTLYIGVTSDLLKRIHVHKHDLIDGFTKRYQVHMLIHYEIFPNIESAIVREKQLKKYERYKKIMLIDKMNPEWNDLYEDVKKNIIGFPSSTSSRRE